MFVIPVYGKKELPKRAKTPVRGVLFCSGAEEGLTAEEKMSVFPILFSIQMISIAWFEKTEGFETLAKTNREMLRFLIEKRAETERLMWEERGF